MLLFYAQGLAQTFNGKEIFKRIDLEVQAGEKTALVGRNGIGKTSLLNIIAGIYPPSGGTLKFLKKTSIAMLNIPPMSR